MLYRRPLRGLPRLLATRGNAVTWARKHGHLIGWAAVIGVVVGADLAGDMTMTESFRAASRSRVGRPVLIISAGYVTGHLFGVIPARYDVLDRACALRGPR